jgi:beta-fructofuranosidase
VLPYSASRFTYYFLGSYHDHQFYPESRGKIDLGGYFYAATSFQDGTGRRIVIAWIKAPRSKEAALKAGWSGILSLPCVLSLGEDGQIEIEPVAEVNELRDKRQVVSNARVAPGADRPLPHVKGDALDIVTEFDPGSAALPR